MTVAFYSPYQGTAQQIKGNEIGYFDEYEFHVDGQLRTMSKGSLIDTDTLCFRDKDKPELLELQKKRWDNYLYFCNKHFCLDFLILCKERKI